MIFILWKVSLNILASFILLLFFFLKHSVYVKPDFFFFFLSYLGYVMF